MFDNNTAMGKSANINQNLQLACYTYTTQEHPWYSKGDNTLFLCTKEIMHVHFPTQQKLVKAEPSYTQERVCPISTHLEGVKASSSKYPFNYVTQVQRTQLPRSSKREGQPRSEC